MDINFDKRNFNDLFFKLKNVKKKIRFIILKGGAGSGKSVATIQHLITEALKRKEKILITRKVASSLNDSIISLIKDTLSDWGLNKFYSYNKVEKHFTFKNGSEILCKGMDDPEKIKSINGISKIFCEEVSEFNVEDVNQLNIRLRGKKIKNPQLYLLFNPVSEDHWLKKMFFDTFRNDTIIFETTYKNNKFLDEDYKKQLEDYKHTDPNYYRIYCLGEWGLTAKGGEAYKHFNRAKHVTDTIVYKPHKPIIMIWDENVSPYSAVILAHVNLKKKRLEIFDEICVDDGSIKDVCDEFKNRYTWHETGLILYGDASLYASSAKLEKSSNTWSLITNFLSDYKPVLKANRKNQSVVMRLNFINNALFTDDIMIRISDKCVKTINDLEVMKTNEDGTKYKQKQRCSIRGKMIEKNGHLSDCFDYCLTGLFLQDYSKFAKGGKSHKPIIIRPRTFGGY